MNNSNLNIQNNKNQTNNKLGEYNNKCRLAKFMNILNFLLMLLY